MRAGAVDAPPRFVGVVVSQRLIRSLAEIVRFLKSAEGGNLQGARQPADDATTYLKNTLSCLSIDTNYIIRFVGSFFGQGSVN